MSLSPFCRVFGKGPESLGVAKPNCAFHIVLWQIMRETVVDLTVGLTKGAPSAPFPSADGYKAERTPTSTLLEKLLASSSPGHVTLEWLFSNLRQRSFGIIMLLLGSIAVLPGVCVLAGVVLIALGVQMLMGREVPVLPRFIARSPLPQSQLAVLIKRVIPVIRVLERFIHPRWQTPFLATKRVVGLVLLLMAMTLFVPVPLSNVVPGVMTMFIALAYLEEDGLLLSFTLTASLVSFGVMLVAAWGATRGIIFLSHI
jgi:hypothetical protein